MNNESWTSFPNENKRPWTSKQLILNAIVGIAPFLGIPQLADWIQNNGIIVGVGLAAVNFLLRLITKSKISLTD